MSFQTIPDVPLLITVPGLTADALPLVSSERRITPAWTISLFKGKMEPITGIPPSCQRPKLRSPGREDVWIEGNEERQLAEWIPYGLVRGAEIEIHDTRPPSARPNLTDENQVEKYVLPTETYETLSNSVLAWKKANHLGRFDPNAKSADEIAAERAERDATLVKEKGIAVGARVVLLPGDTRRGTIRYVGAIPEIPVTSGAGEGATWVGVQLDEPTGKNDGSVKGKRYFEAGSNCGVFVRPEKVDVGDWEVLDDLDLEDEDMEEI